MFRAAFPRPSHLRPNSRSVLRLSTLPHGLRYLSSPAHPPTSNSSHNSHPDVSQNATANSQLDPPSTLLDEAHTSFTPPPRVEQQQAIPDIRIDPLANVKEQLLGWSRDAALRIRERSDKFTANVAVTFGQLGRELNRVTGYGEIETLKRKVVEQESHINASREAAKRAKAAYDQAVLSRARSQREVNDLLQRKSHWSDDDVSRFTSLVREDHAREQEESRAKAAVAASEDEVEREFSELMRVILNRYHEEQAWSDKIRSASTYGSLAAIGLNMAVFVLAIIFVEPWKRRRLTQTFERKVEQMTEETTAAFENKTEELTGRMDSQDKLLTQILETVYSTTQVPEGESLAPPETGEEPMRSPSTEQKWTSGLVKSNEELALALATSATVAGILGWLARSWYS